MKYLFIPMPSQGTLNVKSDLGVKTWSLLLVPLSLVNLQLFPQDCCASLCQFCCAPCQLHDKEQGGKLATGTQGSEVE